MDIVFILITVTFIILAVVMFGQLKKRTTKITNLERIIVERKKVIDEQRESLAKKDFRLVSLEKANENLVNQNKGYMKDLDEKNKAVAEMTKSNSDLQVKLTKVKTDLRIKTSQHQDCMKKLEACLSERNESFGSKSVGE